MQWKIVYALATGFCTAVNSRDPQDGEGVLYLDQTQCAWANVYPERYRVENGALVERQEWAEEREAEIFKEKIKQAADTVESLIQARVDAYNEDHGLAFSDVHNCESYSRVQTYSHRQFCEDVWLWSVDMWETARSIQAEVIAGQRTMPDEGEFLSLLPKYNGVE